MHGLLAILIYQHMTLPHLGLFLGHLPMPHEVHIVRTDISAVSEFLTTTTSSALEICEPQYDVGFSTSDSWSLSHLGYLYPGTTPVMIKLDHNRSCPWV